MCVCVCECVCACVSATVLVRECVCACKCVRACGWVCVRVSAQCMRVRHRHSRRQRAHQRRQLVQCAPAIAADIYMCAGCKVSGCKHPCNVALTARTMLFRATDTAHHSACSDGPPHTDALCPWPMQSRCRCGRAVHGSRCRCGQRPAQSVPVQMLQGWAHLVPVQMWQSRARVPMQT